MEETSITSREGGLNKALTQRQITMIGIGGAIGTGLFMGSGIAIGYAGPGVLISYAIAALIAVIMVFSLAEMAVAHPTAGSFGTYAEMYLNRGVGFVVRYTYWVIEVVAVGGEAIAVGVYMGFWFPGIPVWLWSMAFGVALIYVNCRSVTNFGSFEYWFALTKVVAIIAFIVVGIAHVFGLGTGTPPVGMHNLTGLPGGFMPHGFHGVWMGVLMAIFSFYGVEIVAVTSGEAKDPSRAIPHALRSMVLRLTLFYILALGIMVAYLPWTEAGARVVQQSPFVKLFAHAGIAHAAGIMNFVVITAALSSMNTNIYLSSRTLFSLARGGFAPRWIGTLSANGTPLVATLISGAGVLLAAAVSFFSPLAYNYLFGIALFGGIFVWIVILVTHLRFRQAWKGRKLPVRMPLFPIAQITGIALLSAILITMGLDTEFWDISWIVGVPWLIAVSAVYLIYRKRLSQAAFAKAASA
ncbi:amino acid/polyamine/organocation transporter (APC superfamily) [Paraburkholderia sp. BL23I1N1]|uniref:amino acid permease n=1 Tax=Paraburkholderia sp. BL23I1N1 TaxID=1938802 RepID=UPI000E755679|nr:amino acid permease [Paraburkholderia sp. BL23I1N1]RKE39477.1 amino acid/polyamine/organocation transporter (APC superfamily) [Paraburkholderia sp. BL23I1N1]